MPELVTTISAITGALAALAVLAKLFHWAGKVDTDRESFKAFMGEVRKDIRALQNTVSTILLRLSPEFVHGASRVRLNDRGETAAKILNARVWANEHARGLEAECAGLKEYQIYELCQDYVMANRGRWPENMAECAYEFGSPVEPLAEVPIVVLRDELLRRQQQVRSEGL